MAKPTATLSKEYVSDSDSDSDSHSHNHNEFKVPKFEIPNDYKKCKHLKLHNYSHITNSSKDKQLWLFKLPNDIDLSSIKTLPIDLKDNETTTIKINNKEYEIELNSIESRDNSNLSVLIPNKDNKDQLLPLINTKNNKKIKNNFDKIFNINEMKDIPKIDYEKVVIPRKNVQKVDGLILRHFATGYDESSVPSSIETVSKKRSHDEEISKEESDKSSSTVEKPLKKKKKDKKEKKDKKDKKHKKKQDKK